MITRIDRSIFNNIPPITCLQTNNKINLKAAVILGIALGAFFALTYYLTRSSISVQKSTLKIQLAEKAINSELSSNEYLGKVASTSDCFYDALSQALEQMGTKRSSKQLRLDVNEALKKPETVEKIRQNIADRYSGIDSIEKYLKYVQYTNDELAKIRQNDPEVPLTSYKGQVEREGKILLNMHQFTLHVYTAQQVILLDQNKMFYRVREDLYYPDSPDPISSTRSRKPPLPSNPPSSFHRDAYNVAEVEGESVLMRALSRNTNAFDRKCYIATYENHFVPVLMQS